MKVDLVIVGAGTHGLFLFNQLKQKYKNIIILEQGTFNAKKIYKKVLYFMFFFPKFYKFHYCHPCNSLTDRRSSQSRYNSLP